MARYLITGGTGLIGSALIKELLKVTSNEVLCPVRNVSKALSLFEPSDRLVLVETELESYLSNLDEAVDYIVHCASPTASKFFVEHPVETLHFGISTTESILKYAKSNPVKRVLYLSSLEVYGTVTDDSVAITEDVQGYVDPLSVRSSYNMVKRVCESLCYAYNKEYNVPVVIARLTQIVSPRIEKNDVRVFAQFCRKAASKESIELHTTGESARQYVYIDDAVSALLAILHEGEPGEAYNVANESTYISAKDLAYFLQRKFNPDGRVLVKLQDGLGYAPTTKLKLDTTKLRKLGWIPRYNLEEMAESIISVLRKE